MSYDDKILIVGVGSGKLALLAAMMEMAAVKDDDMLIIDGDRHRGIEIVGTTVKPKQEIVIPIHARPGLFEMPDFLPGKPSCPPNEWGQKRRKHKKRKH